MTFKTHLTQIGKSTGTAYKYSSAITGKISQWAMDAGLCTVPLDKLASISELIAVSDKLNEVRIYQERNSNGGNMYSCALKAFIEYKKSESSEELEHDIENILEDKTIAETEKSTYINTRIGQGRYRRDLIAHWQTCALTGYSDTRLLVASHIKPWKVSDNEERLDSYNGLLLLPNLDKIFDLGFITFEINGKIIISNYLEETNKLGVKLDMCLTLEEPHQSYIEYHRDVVFEKGM